MTEVATSPKTETTPVARASRFWPAALFGVVWGLGWPAGSRIPVIISFLWVMVAGVTLAVQGRPQVTA